MSLENIFTQNLFSQAIVNLMKRKNFDCGFFSATSTLTDLKLYHDVWNPKMCVKNEFRKNCWILLGATLSKTSKPQKLDCQFTEQLIIWQPWTFTVSRDGSRKQFQAKYKAEDCYQAWSCQKLQNHKNFDYGFSTVKMIKVCKTIGEGC